MTTQVTFIDALENVDELFKKISLEYIIENVKEVWNSMDENMIGAFLIKVLFVACCQKYKEQM